MNILLLLQSEALRFSEISSEFPKDQADRKDDARHPCERWRAGGELLLSQTLGPFLRNTTLSHPPAEERFPNLEGEGGGGFVTRLRMEKRAVVRLPR